MVKWHVKLCSAEPPLRKMSRSRESFHSTSSGPHPVRKVFCYLFIYLLIFWLNPTSLDTKHTGKRQIIHAAVFGPK